MRKDFDTGAQAFNFITKNSELKQCEIETISFEEPIDSSNMNPKENSKHSRVQFLDFDGFVHGSDNVLFCVSIELYA
jgi:L-asparaginase